MTKTRAPLLDIFRILLCLGVFVYHLTPERCSSGPLAVNGFLVMSGFLVGVQAFSKQGFDCLSFYRNKSLRLLPMLTMALGLGIAAHVFRGTFLPQWTPNQWGHFSLVDYVKHYNISLWYMVVECTMLVIAPFYITLAKHKYKLELLFIFLFLFTGWLFSHVPENIPFGCGLYFSPLPRSWQFIAGILAGRHINIFRKLYTPVAGKVLLYCLFAIFIIAMSVLMIFKQDRHLSYWNYTFTFDFLTIVLYTLLIPGAYLQFLSPPVKISRVIEKAATFTYPIYLVHVIARDTCCVISNKIAGDASPFTLAYITLFVSIITAWFMLCVNNKFCVWASNTKSY